MTKKSKITSLLVVVPLIASAVFLSNSTLVAANSGIESHSEVRHKTSAPHTKHGVAGVVTSINGNIIIVTNKENVQYTVDASSATIMKEAADSSLNPDIVTISDIKVGDTIVARGVITDTEVTADKIFDGKMPHRHHKHLHNHL